MGPLDCFTGRVNSGKLRLMMKYAAITFGLTAILTAILWYFIKPLDLVFAWLISITLVTFLTYGFDKQIAGSSRMRVPERVLLALTLAGGTLGAYVGMRLFRHKTIKTSFRVKFWTIVIIQVAVLALYYLWLRPWLIEML